MTPIATETLLFVAAWLIASVAFTAVCLYRWRAS
jgi:hypothetical protein